MCLGLPLILPTTVSFYRPINSWDRQPFLTTVRTGKPSTQMQWRQVFKNVVIANYGGSKQVDNDDGSLFWRTYENFMAYGERPPPPPPPPHRLSHVPPPPPPHCMRL